MGKRTDYILAGLIALWASAANADATCRPDRVDVRGEFGQARFRVEVADDSAERATGLMRRPSMPAGHGMLFVYDTAGPVSFWMHNTLIPLDMIFMDETGTVTRVHENARPLDKTPIDGGDDVLTVLEINGGLARQIGIVESAELRHPAVPQDVATWPCDAN